MGFLSAVSLSVKGHSTVVAPVGNAKQYRKTTKIYSTFLPLLNRDQVRKTELEGFMQRASHTKQNSPSRQLVKHQLIAKFAKNGTNDKSFHYREPIFILNCFGEAWNLGS